MITMSYEDARIKALEKRILDLEKENKAMRGQLDYFKRSAIRDMINNTK
jgi:hypothetical protein